MLTDLHLQKYLDGELSEEDEQELEARLGKDPELQARLEALESQSQVVGRHAWQRFRKGRRARRGSRTRYTTMLPALLFLILVLMVARHWFARPGESSTFTLSGGNATGIELLYDSPKGWRYLDQEYGAGDSLTFSVRDTGTYHVAVAAVYGTGPDAEVVEAWRDSPDRAYARGSRKPVFLPASQAAPGAAPAQIAVFYSAEPLPGLSSQRILDLVLARGIEPDRLGFKYQVFSAGR